MGGIQVFGFVVAGLCVYANVVLVEALPHVHWPGLLHHIRLNVDEVVIGYLLEILY